MVWLAIDKRPYKSITNRGRGQNIDTFVDEQTYCDNLFSDLEGGPDGGCWSSEGGAEGHQASQLLDQEMILLRPDTHKVPVPNGSCTQKSFSLVPPTSLSFRQPC